MGYFSNYQLEFFSENEEILTEVASALKKRMKSWSVEDLDYIDPIWEGIYWKDNASNEAEDDIVAISASYPDVLSFSGFDIFTPEVIGLLAVHC